MPYKIKHRPDQRFEEYHNIRGLREPGPEFRIYKLLDGPAATHIGYMRK